MELLIMVHYNNILLFALLKSAQFGGTPLKRTIPNQTNGNIRNGVTTTLNQVTDLATADLRNE